MKKIKCKITEEDIQYGKRCESQGCPVYFAAVREIEGVNSIGPRWISTINNNIIGLPREAVEFIYHFDSGYPVKPIEFEVEVP